MERTETSIKKDLPMLDGKTKKIRDGDILISAFMIVASLWSAYESFRMSLEVYSKGLANLYTVPGLLPFFVSVAILGCSINVFVHAIRVGGDLKFLRISSLKKSFSNMEAFTPFIVFGSIFVYVFILAENIPFEVATFIFVFFIMILFKSAKLLWAAIISLLYALAIVYFFYEVVGISFPLMIFFH